jgi:uncharacterized protein (TIGR03437 family)
MLSQYVKLVLSVVSVGSAGFIAGSGTASAQVLANPFLDDTHLQVINLTMAPSDWATLQQNYLLDTYYHATFTWNGITENVGIRSHGGGSRSPVKPNLDINFAHYQTNQAFLGLPFIVLKANNEDASNMREWVSMKMFRKMGLPAPREAPAQVFLNGSVLGFFYIVEHIDETMIQRLYGENGGYLYEWEAVNNYNFGNLGTDPSLYAPILELKSNQAAPDLQTFANLVQAINQPSSANFTDDDFILALSAYLDPLNLLTYAAVDQVMADSDGFLDGVVGVNNFYLYQMQGTTQYEWIAWDKDNAFTIVNWDILAGINGSGIEPTPDINVLVQRLVGIPGYMQAYLNAVVKTATLLGGAGGWADQAVSSEYAVIASAAENDPNKQCVLLTGGLGACAPGAFDADVQWLHAFLAQRSAFVLQEAASDGYQASTGLPQITAVSTVNGIADVSPGALVNINGTGLGSSAQASDTPLPRVLMNTYVAVEGVRAPLVATASGNIEAQIPPDIPVGTASMVVSVAGQMSSTSSLTVMASTPAILGLVHPNGSAVTLSQPPVAGEALAIYAVGLGAVNVNLIVGAASPSTPLATTATAPQAALNPGGAAMTVLSSELAPGYVGLYQVNALVPASLPPGGATGCTLSLNGQSANWQFSQ